MIHQTNVYAYKKYNSLYTERNKCITKSRYPYTAGVDTHKKLNTTSFHLSPTTRAKLLMTQISNEAYLVSVVSFVSTTQTKPSALIHLPTGFWSLHVSLVLCLGFFLLRYDFGHGYWLRAAAKCLYIWRYV